MNLPLISPFVAPLKHVFSTAMQLEVDTLAPVTVRSGNSSYDVAGMVTIKGEIEGSIAISLAKPTAERLVRLFTGRLITADHPDFVDALGELVSLVCAHARGRMENTPRVLTGHPQVALAPVSSLVRPRGVPCAVVLCASDCGPFALEVALTATQTAGAVRAA